MALAYITQKQADWAVRLTRDLLRDWNRQQFAMRQSTIKLEHALTLLPIGEYAEISPYYQLRGAIQAAIDELATITGGIMKTKCNHCGQESMNQNTGNLCHTCQRGIMQEVK